MSQYLISRGKKMDLARPLLMGVLNVTPDSFSDGGRYVSVSEAVRACLKMIDDGADMIDIGGEATGPGSREVSLAEELKRVIPVVEQLRLKTDAWISVDTWKAQVARLAVKAGADMINDVTALRGDVEMAKVIAELGVPVVLMYSKDPVPRTTLDEKVYVNVVDTVMNFLRERLEYASRFGIAMEKCVLDPGMGAFISMDPKYSLQILKRLKEIVSLGRPVLVGASRKSFIGKVLGLPVGERLEGGLACLAHALMGGAAIIRTHDVKESARFMKMYLAINQS